MKPLSSVKLLLPSLIIITQLSWSVRAETQSTGLIEIRDPLRGLTYYSVEISKDPVNELQFIDKLFPADDAVTIGISALLFDDSKTVDEYILWFHHDGSRRWFTSLKDNPLSIHFRDRDSLPELLHISSSIQTGKTTSFTEKLEFILSAGEFLSIVDSDSVVLELSTALGNISKQLTEVEMTLLLKFDARVRKLHADSRNNTDRTGYKDIPVSARLLK